MALTGFGDGQTDPRDLTAELLRRCLQARWRPEALEEARALGSHGAVAWDALVDTARAEGLGPLLYHATRGLDLLPAHVEQELRRQYLTTARRNVLVFRALEEVLCRLEDAHIPVILLKGAALAQGVYGNVALRPMDDVDLLVREAQVPGAIRAMASLGYSPVPPRAYRSQVRLVHADRSSRPPFELHWSLFVSFYHQSMLPADWLWETALTQSIGDASAHILGPEAQVLHLCGHLALHHGGENSPRGLWLHDVAALLDSYRGRLNWDALLARAETCGLVLSLQQVLGEVTDVWRAPLASRVLDRVRALEPSSSELRALAALSPTNRPALQRFVSELAALPGFGQRLRVVWRNLFPPAAYLKEVYRLPHPLLLPLAYPYCWLAGLASALRAIVRPRFRSPGQPSASQAS